MLDPGHGGEVKPRILSNHSAGAPSPIRPVALAAAARSGSALTWCIWPRLMLVDLARNDLARICTPGSRYVADLTKVDRYSFVMHLVSRVVGELRQDLDVLHAYRACMNMGTLSGAPKVRAMQLIAQAEGRRRGSYGGAVGYFTAHGDLDTCIVIRSAFVEDGIATVQAGAGIVLDSVPQSEADETRNKARAVLRAIATAHHAQEIF
jgi:anthranilate synthase component 1